jgi:hypothetical protein
VSEGNPMDASRFDIFGNGIVSPRAFLFAVAAPAVCDDDSSSSVSMGVMAAVVILAVSRSRLHRSALFAPGVCSRTFGFVFVLPPERDVIGFSTFDQRGCPHPRLHVGAVCVHWRPVSLSDPAMVSPG